MFEFLCVLLDAFLDDGGSSEVDDYDDYDEDMFANTDAWRMLHPYDYNPFTGGSNSYEDEENGW